MAMRKMTFTIPEEIAAPFLRAIPSAKRSRFVADALEKTLADRHAELIAACDAVNADVEIAGLVTEWQTVNDPIEEQWDDSSAR